MRPLSFTPAIVSALLLAAPALSGTVNDEQIWLNATVMGTLSGTKLAYFVEAQPRFTDGAGRLGQMLLRPAIGWRFNDSVTAYLGYAHVILPIAGAPDRDEDRLFTQLSWTLPRIAAGTLSSRTRLEHRRLSNGNDTGWRAREMIRYVHPFAGTPKLRALLSVEAFVALNDSDWGARKGFDQLRSFVGAEVPLAGKSTFELGYLNQWINDPGGRTRVNHVASLSLFIRP